MARGGKRSGHVLVVVAALLAGLQRVQPSNDAPFVAGRPGLSSVDNAPKSKDFALKSKDFALKSKIPRKQRLCPERRWNPTHQAMMTI
jgi:hypothetical protein